MANTSYALIAPDNTSDATFRAWCSAICTGLAAVGLVQTADTGQATWAAEAKPVGANTYSYYQIYRFNDALQSGGGSNPVFLKIEFGTGGTSNANPGIRISVSSATDGAGILNGTFVSSLFAMPAARTSTTAFPCFFSSDKGRIQVALFVNDATTNAIVFSVSRTVDSAGAKTNEGVNIVTCFESIKNQQFLSNAAGGGKNPAAVATNFMCNSPVLSNGIYGGWGANVGVWPIFPNQGYAGFNDMGLHVMFKANIQYSGQIISLTIYGGTHNYVTVITFNGILMPNGAPADNLGLLVRYE